MLAADRAELAHDALARCAADLAAVRKGTTSTAAGVAATLAADLAEVRGALLRLAEALPVGSDLRCDALAQAAALDACAEAGTALDPEAVKAAAKGWLSYADRVDGAQGAPLIFTRPIVAPAQEAA